MTISDFLNYEDCFKFIPKRPPPFFHVRPPEILETPTFRNVDSWNSRSRPFSVVIVTSATQLSRPVLLEKDLLNGLAECVKISHEVILRHSLTTESESVKHLEIIFFEQQRSMEINFCRQVVRSNGLSSLAVFEAKFDSF